MPRYKKKITNLMEYLAFNSDIDNYRDTHGKELTQDKKALLEVLWFAGPRISEALALTSNDINCTKEFIFVDFFRLKGSKQTDPVPLPKTTNLLWLCQQSGRLFDFSRTTGYRIVKRVFPTLYPHYFRMNRISDVLIKQGIPAVKSAFGVSLSSIEHYVAKIDLKTFGKSLQDEIG